MCFLKTRRSIFPNISILPTVTVRAANTVGVDEEGKVCQRPRELQCVHIITTPIYCAGGLEIRAGES